MRRREPLLLAAALTASMLVAPAGSAGAAPADPCLSTPVDGQRLRNAGKLLEARRSFLVCARDTCPDAVVAACTRWANEVDASVPTVVLTARTSSGQDLENVRVSVDGGPSTVIGARATELEPGRHRFVFERSDGAAVAIERVIHEGEKNRTIAATFPDAPRAATTTGARERRPAPTLVWVAGGVAALGLATSAAFGAVYLTKRAKNDCDTGCSAAVKDDVARLGLVSDVALGVGVVALGVATWLYLTRPAEPPTSAFSIPRELGVVRF